jgi:hypothetical protein
MRSVRKTGPRSGGFTTPNAERRGAVARRAEPVAAGERRPVITLTRRAALATPVCRGRRRRTGRNEFAWPLTAVRYPDLSTLPAQRSFV